MIIPHQPESETTHELADVPNPELVRLSVGPREFLEKMGEELTDMDERIELVDGQAFIDAAAPDGELLLDRLLDPVTRTAIEPLQADYLVLFGERQDEIVKDWGGVILHIGFYGMQKTTGSSSYWAALVDLREMKIVEQFTTTATGTDAGVGLFYGIFVVSDTDGAAQKGVIRNLAQTLTARTTTGPVRVVLLAREVLLTQEGAAAAERQRELDRRRVMWVLPQSLAGYPPFSESALSAAGESDGAIEGEGLVYLYRPYNMVGSAIPLVIRARSDAGEFQVTNLWSGGYFPFRIAAGQVTLWVDSVPQRSVTLDIEAGQTYYLFGSTLIHWKTPRGELTRVDAADARREVVLCKMLPSMREVVARTRECAEEGYTFKQLEFAQMHASGVAYGVDESLPKDPIEAVKWFTVVAETNGASDLLRDFARQCRTAIAAGMAAGAVGEGERRGREWLREFEATFSIEAGGECGTR